MTLRVQDTFDVDIDGMAFGGNGVVRIGGMTVFVEGGIPKDRVRIRIVQKKRRYAVARIVDIVEPSPDRIVPPCPYAGVCGGCTMQAVRPEMQLVFKHRHIVESLQHIGRVSDPPVLEPIASPLLWGYRNKVEWTCSPRRWVEAGDLDRTSVPAIGFHAPRVFSKVIDMEACMLVPEAGNRIYRATRSAVFSSGLPMYDQTGHDGFWRFVMLRHSVLEDRWMVNLITSREEPDAMRRMTEHLQNDFPEILTIVNNITAKKAQIAVGERETIRMGPGYLNERIGGLTFRISANSFFQTNTRGAGLLYDAVSAFADLQGNETVLDLYTGTGTIAMVLAGRAKRVIGVELAPSSIVDAIANADRNGIRNCTFLQGDIRKVYPSLRETVHLVVLDPPRSGLHPDVVKHLLLNGPERMVYVSCNPATLARDVSMLADRYELQRVQPIDMFPHTYHIESVSLLQRKPSARIIS